MMFKKIAIVAGLGLALSAAAEAQTPRKGGTIRMPAPYGSSFSSMDIHTTQRAQDEIYAKGLHRSLYIWDSTEGKPVPELAREVTVSGGGLVYTFKLRDDAYFHHGRKMTADDVIWSFNRIMDGAKAYPGARFVRLIEGASEVEKGQAKDISGLKKIDDFTLEMKLTEKVDPGSTSGTRSRRSIPPTRPPRRASSRSRSVLGHSNLSSTCRDRASFWSGGTGSTSPASRTPTSSSSRSWAKPRRVTSPSATRKSTPRCWDLRNTSPIRPTPTSKAQSLKSPKFSRVTWG